MGAHNEPFTKLKIASGLKPAGRRGRRPQDWSPAPRLASASVRSAPHPLVTRRTAAISPAADGCSLGDKRRGRRERPRDLLPAGSGRHVVDTDVTAGQQLKWIRDPKLAVELGVAGLPERFEPTRGYKIRREHPIDVISIWVCLARVADFVSVQAADHVLVEVEVRHGKGCQIDRGISEHFQQFVARRDSPLGPKLQVRCCKDLSQRQTVRRHVVIAQRPGLVGIVQHHQPPVSGWWLLAFGNKIEIRIDPPGGRKIPRNLRLKCRHDRAHLVVSQRRAYVVDRYLYLGHSLLLASHYL